MCTILLHEARSNVAGHRGYSLPHGIPNTLSAVLLLWASVGYLPRVVVAANHNEIYWVFFFGLGGFSHCIFEDGGHCMVKGAIHIRELGVKHHMIY